MSDKRDFLIIHRLVERAKNDNNQICLSNAFYFVGLDLILDYSPQKSKSCITDSYFLEKNGKEAGYDSGIDAVCFEENIIHLFNFKYTDRMNKVEGNFESDEVNKILGYVKYINNGDVNAINNFNSTLKQVTLQIFHRMSEISDVRFIIHLCSNTYKGLGEDFRASFLSALNDFSMFKLEENHLNYLIDRYIEKNRMIISGKMQVARKQMFCDELENGFAKSLIVRVNALMLLKLISSNEKFRNKATIDDYGIFSTNKIEEKAFDDNVRNFLSSKGKINEQLIETAKSKDNVNFYYYNNGLTILCESCKISGSTIHLTNIQMVNGSQTMHCLEEVCKENYKKLETVDILCRIYAIKNEPKLHSNIAEYTNTQNRVTDRDIKALDYIQIQLEKEFQLIGYSYLRKKDSSKKGNTVLDSEKVGQLLLAFYQENPDGAKNDKAKIFNSPSYEKIFNENVCAEYILDAKRVLNYIEKRSKETKLFKHREESHLKYSSMYLLYGIKKLIDKYEQMNINVGTNRPSELKPNYKTENLEQNYNVAKRMFDYISLFELVEKEKTNDTVQFGTFYKNSAPKNKFLNLLENDIDTKDLKSLTELLNAIEVKIGITKDNREKEKSSGAI